MLRVRIRIMDQGFKIFCVEDANKFYMLILRRMIVWSPRQSEADLSREMLEWRKFAQSLTSCNPFDCTLNTIKWHGKSRGVSLRIENNVVPPSFSKRRSHGWWSAKFMAVLQRAYRLSWFNQDYGFFQGWKAGKFVFFLIFVNFWAVLADYWLRNHPLILMYSIRS